MTAKPRRKTSQAPKGRNKTAQGNALGNAPPEDQSPEGAGQSGELPKGWRWVTLGDVAESMKNGIYKPASSYADDGMACLRMYNIGDGKIVWRDIKRMRLSEVEVKEYELLPGDLLVNRVNSRELVGKSVAIPTGLERCVFESKNIRVRIRRDLVLPEFVSYRLLSAGSRYFTQNAQQVVGMASISQPQVARFPLPLPPLDDQRRIVAEIEKQFTRLEAGVAALRRVQANLKRYRAAVLKAACEGRLVPTEAELARTEGRPFESGQQLLARILTERRQNWQGRGKYKEPASLSTSGYEPDSLPEGWAWATPEQLSSSESYSLGIGPFGSNLKVSDYTTEGVPLIFVRNIRPGRFVKAKEVYVTDAKAEELKAHQALGGDILITKMGAPPGDACLYPEDAPKAVITADCIKFRPSPLLSEKRFFVHALNSDIVKPQILDITKGVAQMKVSLGRFESIAIPLPPLAEQTRIVAEVERRLSVVEELEAVVTTNLQRATRLRQSVLQKAFMGEL
ncbi:MAG: restriction endonuclease subunit S [Verrucomicrobiaceae bacterium]|nr:restriction endonuclease subunit S [Verrucomicrobiaceae bacterium]